MELIDTHAHLDMAPFDRDRKEVIARALAAGVKTIITVGIDLKSSQKAIELAESHPDVLATVGVHPHEAARVTKEDLVELAQIAKHPKVVAIGEMGLDLYRNRSPREAQFRILKWQLELARELGLPVIIHSRQADRDVLSVLGEWVHSQPVTGKPRGVIHCFNSDKETALKYLDMDFFIAFGAYIGYPSSIHIRDAIRAVPNDRLVVETDCPFLPPQIYRGKRNEPAYLPITAGVLANVRRVSPGTVALETTQNACNLFRYPQSG